MPLRGQRWSRSAARWAERSPRRFSWVADSRRASAFGDRHQLDRQRSRDRPGSDPRPKQPCHGEYDAILPVDRSTWARPRLEHDRRLVHRPGLPHPAVAIRPSRRGLPSGSNRTSVRPAIPRSQTVNEVETSAARWTDLELFTNMAAAYVPARRSPWQTLQRVRQCQAQKTTYPSPQGDR
jgi:hypothetical protein